MLKLGFKTPKLTNPSNYIEQAIEWLEAGMDGTICIYDNVFLDRYASSYLYIDQERGCKFFGIDGDPGIKVMKYIF